jgi:hypothetical protein
MGKTPPTGKIQGIPFAVHYNIKPDSLSSLKSMPTMLNAKSKGLVPKSLAYCSIYL